MSNESNEQDPISNEELIAYCEKQLLYHETFARAFRIAEGMANKNDPNLPRIVAEAEMHEANVKTYRQMLERLKK